MTSGTVTNRRHVKFVLLTSLTSQLVQAVKQRDLVQCDVQCNAHPDDR